MVRNCDRFSVSKYRSIIDQMLDLCDQNDPLDLASMLMSAADGMRRRAEWEKSEEGKKARDRAMKPWFIASEEPDADRKRVEEESGE